MFFCFDCIGRCDLAMVDLLAFEFEFAAQKAVVSDPKRNEWRTSSLVYSDITTQKQGTLYSATICVRWYIKMVNFKQPSRYHRSFSGKVKY